MIGTTGGIYQIFQIRVSVTINSGNCSIDDKIDSTRKWYLRHEKNVRRNVRSAGSFKNTVTTR